MSEPENGSAPRTRLWFCRCIMSFSRTTTIIRSLSRTFFLTRHASLSINARRLFRSSASRREEEDIEIEDPGLYEVILPPDPPVWGVSHISPRKVPDCITKPPYVERRRVREVTASCEFSQNKDADFVGTYNGDEKESANFNHDPYTGDGRIQLGSEDEGRVRRSAQLAKRTLEMAANLVRVSTCKEVFFFGLVILSRFPLIIPEARCVHERN